jgi:hypothetical protein
MAKKQVASGARRPSRFLFVKTLGSATTLLSCSVLFIGGMMEGVRTSKIIYNCLGVSFCIIVVFWIVNKALASYEEMNGGKA